MKHLARRFVELLREEGPVAALRSAASHIGDHPALQYHHQQVSARLDADRVNPWWYIWIDPHDVEWSYKKTPRHGDAGRVFDFDITRDAGRIVGGDWDRRVCVKYSDLPKVDGVHRHFVDGLSWEETGLLDHLHAVIEDRGRFDGCETYEELETRYRKIDQLYETIAENGYRSRTELCGALDYGCRLDVPKVHIARDGTFIHAGGSGNHRIAIAQVLDVPVEVRVVVRHEQWANLREEVRDTDSPQGLSDRARDVLSHPDIEAFAPRSWKSRDRDSSTDTG